MRDTDGPISGASALALGAIEAGVSLVTGYAGSPTTAVVNEIVAQSSADETRVEWTSNEKAAVEMAYGGSLAGARSLLCVKSVGLNVALDPLMSFNLPGCSAGLVLLVGDDPGGWGSQNEQDSRALALAVELPTLEPCTVEDAYHAVLEAFRLSEEMGMPVIVRITRALVLALGPAATGKATPPPPPAFQRDFMRWVVLPVNVVSYRKRLHDRLDAVRVRFETSSLNRVVGEGTHGVIACGVAHQKLLDAVGGALPIELRVLGLGTFYPLPSEQIGRFCAEVESVLVLEDGAPLVERAVRDLAQRTGQRLPVYGRDSGHLAEEGELFGSHIAAALNHLLPELLLSTEGETSRPRPSRQSFCEGCPYIPTFDALVGAMAKAGGRERFIVVGDPGCMVRSQLPPYELIDVKNSLGSSIGTAAGLAIGQQYVPQEDKRHVIALSGDSSFLHTGLNGLIDAARVGAQLLVLILDNGTTALSGGQPHPASAVDARGSPRRAVDLVELATATGAESVQVVDLDRGEGVGAAIERSLGVKGVSVIVARGRCPQYPV